MENVSVIMPAYNAEKYIQESIDSVISQTYTKWELIIVNDGSKDKTKDIIEDYVTKYPNQIILIDKKKNEGISKGLNDAIAKSKGPYICWLSSDDVYVKDMLESEVCFLKDHQEYDIVFSNYEHIDSNSEFLSSSPEDTFFKKLEAGDKTQLYRTILDRNCINGCSVMCKKEHYIEAGVFDPKYLYAHDYDMWIRLAAIYNVGYIDKVNVRYRIHLEQGTNLGMNEVDAIRVLFDFMRKEELFDKLLVKAHLPVGVDGIGKVMENILLQFRNRPKEYSVLVEETKKLMKELNNKCDNNETINRYLKKLDYINNNILIKNVSFFENNTKNNWLELLSAHEELDGFIINSDGARFERFNGNDINRLTKGIKFSNFIVLCRLKKTELDQFVDSYGSGLKYFLNNLDENKLFFHIGISYYMINNEPFKSYFANVDYEITDKDIWNTVMDIVMENVDL